jgi:hypothetical protein
MWTNSANPLILKCAIGSHAKRVQINRALRRHPHPSKCPLLRAGSRSGGGAGHEYACHFPERSDLSLVSAAYLVASDGGRVGMKHLLHGTRRELQKMGRLVNERDMNV